MAYALKKIHMAIAALLLVVTGPVHSDDGYSSIDGGFGDSCCCEPECCGRGFFSADLLYLRAFEGGLDDCFPVEDFDYVTSDGSVISKFRGKGEDPQFNWDPGFRIGAGYEFGCGLDVAVFWTHFHSKSSRNRGDSYGYGHERSIHWKLDFDVVDILVGRGFDVGSCFSLRPFGGLRGARIDQKLRTHFSDRNDVFVDSLSTYYDYDSPAYSYLTHENGKSKAHGKERFLGIGPVIGLEGDWNLGCGFSVYANISAAVLYGRFHVRSHESDKFDGGEDSCDVHRRLSACQGVVDAGLGIRWLTCFCSNEVWFQLGLEHHSYFNQNRLGCYGDLCLDGANFSAGFAF